MRQEWIRRVAGAACGVLGLGLAVLPLSAHAGFTVFEAAGADATAITATRCRWSLNSP